MEQSFPEGMTVIAGGNGQGKTSLLEAVYMLATGRSFRSRKIDDLVSWDGGPLSVSGTVQGRLGENRLAAVIDHGHRRLAANGVETGLEHYLGKLALVDLTGRRMEVLKGAPPERRQFLDRGIVGLQPAHLRVHGDYRRVLLQRNTLLRSMRPGSPTVELDAWDERMAVTASRLHRARRNYAARLDGSLTETGRVLFGADRALHVRYKPSPAEAAETDDGAIEPMFAARLERGRARDIEAGHSHEGPHRDELSVELDGVDLRRFGSAGQVRAAMIALKLGKLFLLREERGEPPLFLMDDYDSDLDDGRMSALADFLHHGGFQTLVATSKETQAGRIEVPFMKLRMEKGVAEAA